MQTPANLTFLMWMSESFVMLQNMQTNQLTVYWYVSPSGRNVVWDFVANLSENQRTKVQRTLTLAEKYGLNMIQPYVKKLVGTPLWEIRILGKDNIRVVYVTKSGNAIMVLHAFIKKKQKTPQREINTAMRRLQELASCL